MVGFTCTGPIFDGLVLDYSQSGEFTATFTATDEWEDKNAKITASMSGTTVYNNKVKLCDFLDTTSVTCGSSGTVVLDLSSFLLIDGVTIQPNVLAPILQMPEIEIKTKPDGKDYEYCTKDDPNVVAYQSAAFTSGGAAKTAGFLVGTVALVGLAAYAVKRRNRSKSNNGADQKLNGGELA
mmetsp:Transcript_28378/g.57112  ORF Transcript_28378/g.57112 Transcript_28378/m.57112 type:complete len:181 (+) Transcript_28378:90-632(+)